MKMTVHRYTIPFTDFRNKDRVTLQVQAGAVPLPHVEMDDHQVILWFVAAGPYLRSGGRTITFLRPAIPSAVRIEDPEYMSAVYLGTIRVLETLPNGFQAYCVFDLGGVPDPKTAQTSVESNPFEDDLPEETTEAADVKSGEDVETVPVTIGRTSGPCTDLDATINVPEDQMALVKEVIAAVNAASRQKERWYVHSESGCVIPV